MSFSTATVARPRAVKFIPPLVTFWAISFSGFRRFAAYRQATAAAMVTNTMFGFLRCFVLLAVAGATGVAAGYDRTQLASFVWIGQGLLGVVGFWGWTDLAERIRTGDVVIDLLRPVHPVVNYLAADLGRAGYALLTRLTVPVVAGAFVFDLYLPHRSSTAPLFLLSVLLAVVISFSCRYLTNAAAFWLMEVRGVMLAWALLAPALSGLYFPITFLPSPVATALRLGTPLPSMLQTPLDVAVERVGAWSAVGLVGVQACWAGLLLAGCALVQRRAERRLVVQGG